MRRMKINIKLLLLGIVGILGSVSLLADESIGLPAGFLTGKKYKEVKKPSEKDFSFWKKESDDQIIIVEKDDEYIAFAPPPETGDGQKLGEGDAPPTLPLDTNTFTILFLFLMSNLYVAYQILSANKIINFKNKYIV